MNDKGIMASQRFDIASVALTAFLLAVIATAFVLLEMVALNGVGPKSANLAFGFLLLSQLIVLISAGLFAGWFAKLLMGKYRWNKLPALLVAVPTSTFLGAIGFFIAMILSMLFAGIK